MLTKEQIEEAVHRQIESDEKPGDQAGGSGHMGYVDYTVDEIGEPVEMDNGWEVSYRYTIEVTTEFTIEPDNPPYRYPKEGKVIIGDA
jgi:hypothetical protein